MKAIQVQEPGERVELPLVEVPDPQPKEGEVLIEVKAAGINYSDINMTRGVHGSHRPFPYIAGFEAAGVVMQCGKDVSGWKPGQRVMGTTLREMCGCYAEKAVMPAWLLMPLPEPVRFEEGAAFPEVFITAYLALQTYGHLARGESVLIHTAAGGVGTAAVQIAHEMGARIFATSSSDEKLRRVKELGADVVINYVQGDFLDVVKKETDGKGVDVVLESTGGEVFKKSLNCLQAGGRLVIYGNLSGALPTPDLRDVLWRSLSLSGFIFWTLCTDRPEIVRQTMQAVLALLEQGKVHPVVGHVFPLAEARAAHDLIRRRANFGKVILVP